MNHRRFEVWSRREALGLGALASAGFLGLGTSLRSTSVRTGVLGPLDDIEAQLARNPQLRFPNLRATLVRYAPNADTRVMYAESPPGLLLLLWKCPHLGCTLMLCESSGWFECPCHGARFNEIGEYRFGPPPRGMDRHPLRVTHGGDLVADTRNRVLGPPRGTATLRTPPRGPHCVG
ncbi:MAG TPA: Rieske 2Fe-2S domain-containing protein [Mycobacteriales bacterium]|nr:Rieske 2Fe-2S domain-containing protein [Mycobacteriales bacterium]